MYMFVIINKTIKKFKLTIQNKKIGNEARSNNIKFVLNKENLLINK